LFQVPESFSEPRFSSAALFRLPGVTSRLANGRH
jgi:hypothetical protein